MSDVSAVAHLLPKVNEGFNSTTGGTVASGGASVSLTDMTGLVNGTTFVGIIEPGNSKQQVFTGTVDVGGSQITGVKWTRGTNVSHAGGVTVVDYITGTAINMITRWAAVQHNDDGTHANVTANSVSTSGAVTAGNTFTLTSGNFNVPNNSIPAAALSTSAITLGYAQITANFTGSGSATQQVTGLTASVTIPGGGRRVKITAQATAISGTGTTVLSIWDGAVGSGTQLNQINNSAGAGSIVVASATPSAGAKTYNVGVSSSSGTVGVTAGATIPAFILVELI